MIDADKVKKFWEDRAEKLGAVAFESIVNLEEDPDALAEKIRVERPFYRMAHCDHVGADASEFGFHVTPLVPTGRHVLR